MLYLIFSKPFHKAWISLDGQSTTNRSLQLGFCPQFSVVSVFSKVEAFILKKDTYPQAGYLSLPKANLPNDMPCRFRGLKIEVSLDDVLMVTTLGIIFSGSNWKMQTQPIKFGTKSHCHSSLPHFKAISLGSDTTALYASLMIKLDYTNLEVEQCYSEYCA